MTTSPPDERRELMRKMRQVVAERQRLEAELWSLVEAAREHGVTWGEIGVAIGRERSNARMWFVRYRPPSARS